MTSPKQLDIFNDSESVRVTNALSSALSKGEAREALSAYRTLSKLESTHPWLPHAKVLIEALQTPLPTTAQDARSALVLLDRSWGRAADALFGAGNHSILVAMWRAVAERLNAAEFDPSYPRAHPSYAYSKLGASASVERSVLAVPHFEQHAVLLSRIAQAEWCQRRRVEAISHWCALCWLAPKMFDSLMNDGGILDRALCDHWSDAVDQDFEPPPTGVWFPAWTLLKEPGLARHLNAPTGTTPPETAFSTIQSLLLADGTDTSLRKRLQALHPELLTVFLARRY